MIVCRTHHSLNCFTKSNIEIEDQKVTKTELNWALTIPKWKRQIQVFPEINSTGYYGISWINDRYMIKATLTCKTNFLLTSEASVTLPGFARAFSAAVAVLASTGSRWCISISIYCKLGYGSFTS